MTNDAASLPLISCMMPTANRKLFVPQAIRYFQAQDYPNKELVIVDDGTDGVSDLVPDDAQVRYVRLEGERTLGAKRNECVEMCRGDLIMHWDDDDWMAPYRISYQAKALLRARGEVCGLQKMIFYELATARAWLYQYPRARRPWLAGGSLLYTREFWRRMPFPDVQVASDTHFVWRRKMNHPVIVDDYSFYVAMIHPGNTSPKRYQGACWTPWNGEIQKILGEDYPFYASMLDGNERVTQAPRRVAKSTHRADAKPHDTENTERGEPAQRQSARDVSEQESETSDSRIHDLPDCLKSQTKLRIGYVLSNFPALSETFIRREVLALCRAGHRVFVYTHSRHHDPLVEELNEPNLTIREIAYARNPAALVKAIAVDGVEHLHSSLMISAQRAAYDAAHTLQIPFTLTAYSGHDTFTLRDTRLYRDISSDPLCVAIIVEDSFMRDWMVNRLGALAEKVTIIPNSFDTGLYRLREPRPRRASLVILAIARFVEKKGLVNLVQAFQKICAAHTEAELWLVGSGSEERRLRRAAANNPKIKFLGSMTEAQTQQAYADADIFCLPCIQTKTNDADGIPTTVLEAMSFELPVVTSDLLSASFYVRDGQEGLLTPPGDVESAAAALERLCADRELREELGRKGRARVSELCDLSRNIERLQEVMIDGRRRRWHRVLAQLDEHRASYTGERESYYVKCRKRAVEYFAPKPGRLLDVGCGQGDMRHELPPGVAYFGCDPLLTEPPQSGFHFTLAHGERLPFPDEFFDSVLLHSMLINVFDVDAVLAEAARVLKPAGMLFIRECVDDHNQLHLNHFTVASLRERVAAHFKSIASRPDVEKTVLMKATKTANSALEAASSNISFTNEPPLVSVAITTYNRERFLRHCIDSVLKQTYRPIEIIVVDDGSTDNSRRILDSYKDAVRVVYNEQNRGIAYAKNRALQATSEASSYVALLDSDDYYHPRFVERCVNFLEKNREVGLVYTDDTLVNVNGRALQRRQSVEPWSVDAWLRSCNLRGDSWMARRDLVMKTSLHDESLSHDVDYDLFYQLLEFTTFAHLRENLVYIRHHAAQITRQTFDLAKCHAANLVKYGYSPEYAYMRAGRRRELVTAIEQGIALGNKLREQRSKTTNGNGAHRNGDSNGHGKLAIDGGSPVRSSFLTFGAPCLGEEEIAEVVDTMRSGWIGTGPKTERFEQEFAAYVGAKHAIALNSCTAGLFLSLTALGIGPGHEVITTAFTFGATVNVIEIVGARPRLVDIDPATLNINPELVAQAVTTRTRAIIPVHFGGLSCDMDALKEIADRHQLAILEDAAHAVGTRYQGRMAGTFGNLASFSFYANKNLTTAEGGMVTTDDAALAERIRRLRLHGLDCDAWKRFGSRQLMKPDIRQPGYKHNMPDLAASIGIHQLHKQEEFLQTRERYARRYDEAFAGLPVRLQTRPSSSDLNRHSLHLYVLILDQDRWRVHRDEVIEALLKENIGAAIHYRAIHTHSFYRDKYGYKAEDFPHSYGIGERIISLPLTPAMSERDVTDVINAVHKVARAYAVT